MVLPRQTLPALGRAGRKRWRINLRSLLLVLLIGGMTALAGVAAEAEGPPDRLLRTVFPDAERFGPAEGTPPAIPAYRGGELAGYVFFTKDFAGASGFAGRPLNIAVGLSRAGLITGAELIEHSEPILMIGVPEPALTDFVRQYRGLDIRRRIGLRALAAPGENAVDAISAATVSSLAFNEAILAAARAVARSRQLLEADSARLDIDSFVPEGWEELRAAGSIAQRTVTIGEAERALRESGGAMITGAAEPDAPLIVLYTAFATPAQIGANLLGTAAYRAVMADSPAGTNLVFIAARGLYSFKGTAWIQGGVFDRIQIVQDERTIVLTREQHRRLDRLAAADAPELREAALFVLPPESGLDPARPWRLDLAVAAPRTDGDGQAMAVFQLRYEIPRRHLRSVAAATAATYPDQPLWRQVWEARWSRVAVLGVVLIILTAILVFQDSIASRRRFWIRLRLAVLAFTLVWLGWYAAAQLSVLNVLTFTSALLTKFEWDYFLLDPMIFTLWSFVAVALLFWGRGVFCGWLCPFGALQEIANRVARRLRLPQLTVPFGLHERLWPIKYIVFLALLAISLGSMQDSVRGAEIEPFKTAINLHFVRAWPFVAYALALLAAGLFVERFFCRYLCPLGAALAIPARLRMFEWLKRRWQCGRECHICETRCPVQAIQPDGRINPNECIYCLKCQTLYFDDQTCPPLITRRKRREERAAARQSTDLTSAEP